LWTHAQQFADDINAKGENVDFLPGFAVPAEIRVTADTQEAVGEAEIVVGVVPSEFLRQTYKRIAPSLHAGQILVSATKGVEDETFLRMSEVIDAALKEQGLSLPCGVMSGPSFASEVAAGMPTAITIAFDDIANAVRVQGEFSSGSLRLYSSDDVIGVELGGALKNVIAIASGTVAGLGLGGLLYVVGAIVYASGRPDPAPKVFGYHEVFHALVIAAAGLHYAVIAFAVLPRG